MDLASNFGCTIHEPWAGYSRLSTFTGKASVIPTLWDYCNENLAMCVEGEGNYHL